uniref:Agouti domain-containing protein n=1 Tax=Gouania willdenowi TaxID=441366 RepID=A0A8C5H6Y5_GOUWI
MEFLHTHRMKLTLFLCLLYVSLGCCRLFARTESLTDHRDPAGPSPGPQSAGSVSRGRIQPLFARRGQYERQRSPSKLDQDSVKPTCSQLTQSCRPVSGCCDVAVMCHCRFFNTICFCHRAKS